MNIKTMTVAVLGLAAGNSVAVDFWAPKDLAAIDIEAENPDGTSSPAYFRTGDGGGVFTLGSDINWTGKVQWIGISGYNNNPIVFDFTNGNHTVTCNQVFWASKAFVTFLGGNWIAPGDWRLQGYGTATERKVVFDAASLDCARNSGTYFWGANGNDNVIVLTNGAKVAGNTSAFIHATGKRNRMHVSTGSQVVFGSVDLDRGVEGTDYGLTSNRVDIAGPGTYFQGKDGKLMAGYWSSGNMTRVGDHAVVGRVASTVVGYGEYARSNTLEIVNHAVVTNGEGMSVGRAPGATHNRIVIRDSEYYNGNTYSADVVGYQGSYNEALFENVNFSSLFRISCGILPAACHNTVTLKGETKIANASGSFRFDFFGQGQHNTFILDNFSHNWSSARANMSLTENDKSERPSTNNTLRIVNGSNFRFYDFTCSAACTGNTIEIKDATAFEGHDFQILGNGNTLILDNGTLYLTQSGGNLLLGSDTLEPGGTGNRFIIRGAHPKVLRSEDRYFAGGKIGAGNKMVIEVPETGYAPEDLPIFDRTGMTFYNGATLEIDVPEEILKNLPGKAEYKLLDSVVLENYPGGEAQFLADINAKLPERCTAYKTDAALYLRVRPYTGLTVIVR